MRIVCLSDTHGKHKQVPVPDGDVLVHAGDMTGLGNWSEFISVGNWFRAMRDRFKHRIMIAGNHDWGLEINKRLVLEAHFDKDLIYLQDSGVCIDGVNIYGTPWMPVFYNWAFMHDESELPKYYAAIPDNTQVLITHAPPLGILDKEDDNARCGSSSLLARVKELKELKHHIFGHIHESYGVHEEDGVVFHNVASLNGAYRYQNPPQVIDI